MESLRKVVLAVQTGDAVTHLGHPDAAAPAGDDGGEPPRADAEPGGRYVLDRDDETGELCIIPLGE